MLPAVSTSPTGESMGARILRREVGVSARAWYLFFFAWSMQQGIVKLTLSERTYRVELTSFALIGRHRLPPARR